MSYINLHIQNNSGYSYFIVQCSHYVFKLCVSFPNFYLNMQALVALYEAGVPAIGQIHTGNVFKLDGRYLLGGYENILLGYRTSCYQDFAGNVDWMNRIDVIMFGTLLI